MLKTPAIFIASFLFASVIAAAGALQAAGLKGKSYIIQMSSSQMASGYAEYLVPPLAAELAKSGMKAMSGPGAELAVTVNTNEDVGQWMVRDGRRQWIYTFSVTVGLSPADGDIPDNGPPVFGVTATLLTPSSGRDDELECLIRTAARKAIADYRPKGAVRISGQKCLGR